MTTREELQREIGRLIVENNRSTIVILGAPGAGKTSLLNDLARQLERQDRRTVVYGPISMATFQNTATFRHQLLVWLEDEGLLRQAVHPSEYLSAASLGLFLEYVHKQLDPKLVGKLVIETDDVDAHGVKLYEFYSELRKFCSEWQVRDLAVHFISAGTWNPIELEQAFKDHESSWPFVAEHNLFYLPDLTKDEVLERLRRRASGSGIKPIHALYLWELTSGDAPAVNEIIQCLPQQTISCESIYNAADTLIRSQFYADKMEARLSTLSAQALETLGRMLTGYHPVAARQPAVRDELILSGLGRVVDEGNGWALRFKNWLAESTIRHHRARYDKQVPDLTYPYYEELIPPVSCLNREAYGLICEIENQLRNLVMLRLHAFANGRHPLWGVVTKETNRQDTPSTDEYTRASRWRARVQRDAYVDTHAALISFSQTRHLIGLIDYLIDEKDDPFLGLLDPLRDDLAGFKNIRDAVTHNQVISEKSYDLLVKIRQALYANITN
jgi:hypothetical protein